MKPLTSSVFSFEKLRKEGFCYVDKTEYLWQLIRNSGESYFLARPRRFGKSLTVSTLKAIFEGRKELFEGLALYDKPYDWKKYPVLHLSLGDYNPMNDTPDKLNRYLVQKVCQLARTRHIEPLVSDDPSAILGQLIDTLSENGGQVVILIDEYDKPLLDNVLNPDIANLQRTLKGFYGVLKDRNAEERFLFITGVSKFSHVSLFSELNNLTDISMDARFATMLGYTQQELEANFPDYLEQAAANNHLSMDECKEKVKAWYNGFRFHANSATVYNPVSIAKFFEQGGEFRNYWFSTGTPAFLLDVMKKKSFDLESVLAKPLSGFAFDAYEVERIDPLALLLQTGYLTIGRTEQRYSGLSYYLCFPNLEVKGSFQTYLASDYSGINVGAVDSTIYRLADAVRDGEVDTFMETMKTFFAKVPYDLHMKSENNFQVLFYSIFLLLGINIAAESRTNAGRIDAVAQNEDFVFVFEFKLNRSGEIALDQIKDRDYYRRYMDSGKRIVLVGANFDPTSGQLSDWKSEEVKTR